MGFMVDNYEKNCNLLHSTTNIDCIINNLISVGQFRGIIQINYYFGNNYSHDSFFA